MYLFFKFEMTLWLTSSAGYLLHNFSTYVFCCVKYLFFKQALKSLHSISSESKRNTAIECWFTRAFVIREMWFKSHTHTRWSTNRHEETHMHACMSADTAVHDGKPVNSLDVKLPLTDHWLHCWFPKRRACELCLWCECRMSGCFYTENVSNFIFNHVDCS